MHRVFYTLLHPKLTLTAKGYVLVLFGSVWVSFAGLFVKGASIDPAMVAFYRLFFGGAFLGVVAVIRRERLIPSWSMLWIITLAALFFAAHLITWHDSIIFLGPGLATIIANFQVFFLAIFGALFLKEHMSWRHMLSIPLALFGLLLLLEIDPRHMPPHVLEGIIWGFIAAIFFAGYILELRHSQLDTRQRLPAIANMAIISLLGAVFVGIYCLHLDISFAIPDWETAGIMVGIGILCQGLGWFLVSIGLPYVSASRAGLLILSQPALTFICDIIFLGRPTGLVGLLGAIVTIGAIYLGLAAPGESSKTPDKRGESPGTLDKENAHSKKTET